MSDLPSAIDEEFGPTDWVELDAAQLQKFGEATYMKDKVEADWQVSQNNELGSELIDGFLLVSLMLPLHGAIWPFYDSGTWALNYGLDKVRFLEPVYVGDRVRLSTTITDVTERGQGIRVVTTNVLEVDGHEKPALVADWVALYLPSGAVAA